MEPINEADVIQTIMDMMKQIEESSSESSKVISLIQSLGKLNINAKILKKTKAGKKMSKLSSSSNPEIKKFASETVSNWKKQVRSLKDGKTVKKSSKGEIESKSEEKISTEKVKESSTEPASEETKQEESGTQNPPARVRQADVEYEEEKNLEAQNEDYDEYILNNQTEDKIRNNIRKGEFNFSALKITHF